jgi:hypothetical protein
MDPIRALETNFQRTRDRSEGTRYSLVRHILTMSSDKTYGYIEDHALEGRVAPRRLNGYADLISGNGTV